MDPPLGHSGHGFDYGVGERIPLRSVLEIAIRQLRIRPARILVAGPVRGGMSRGKVALVKGQSRLRRTRLCSRRCTKGLAAYVSRWCRSRRWWQLTTPERRQTRASQRAAAGDHLRACTSGVRGSSSWPPYQNRDLELSTARAHSNEWETFGCQQHARGSRWTDALEGSTVGTERSSSRPFGQTYFSNQSRDDSSSGNRSNGWRGPDPLDAPRRKRASA